MNTERNIWILGGTGFVGTALVKQLSEDPANLLHLLVHKHIPYKLLEPFNTFTGSLESFDLSWIEKYPPDIIFHIARLSGGNGLMRRLAAKRGAKANHRLIQFLQGMKKPPVVVYISGSLMYGNQVSGYYANEQSPLQPISYARHYVGAEEPWLNAQAMQLLDVRFARPGWIIGPASWFKVFYWDYYTKTGMVPMFGDGQQLMSLIHLDDCAGQAIHLGLYGSKQQDLNIFAGPAVTQQVFAETLAYLLKATIRPFSLKELISIYGITVAEALTSSIPLQTAYGQMRDGYVLQCPSVGEMLSASLLALKDKESVFAKTP